MSGYENICSHLQFQYSFLQSLKKTSIKISTFWAPQINAGMESRVWMSMTSTQPNSFFLYVLMSFAGKKFLLIYVMKIERMKIKHWQLSKKHWKKGTSKAWRGFDFVKRFSHKEALFKCLSLSISRNGHRLACLIAAVFRFAISLPFITQRGVFIQVINNQLRKLVAQKLFVKNYSGHFFLGRVLWLLKFVAKTKQSTKNKR